MQQSVAETASFSDGTAYPGDLHFTYTQPAAPMSDNASSIFGTYFKMDSTIDLLQSTPLVVRSSHLAYYVAIGAILMVVYLFQIRSSSKLKRVNAPFYKASVWKWMFDADNLVRDSYNKFYDKIYQIKATEGVQVLVPAKYLGELRGLPEDVLSATEAVADALMSKYTNFAPAHQSDLLSTVVRVSLTQNLARLVPQLKAEIEYIVATEFPECKDWTAVKVQPFALRTIARTSGRAFVGPAINRTEEWMDTSINFAVHIFLAVVKLQFFPEWLRPIGQYLVSDLRKIKQDIEKAKRMLQPVIEERLRDMECPGYEGPDDLIQWLLQTMPEQDRRNFYSQAELQLILSAASIHTTNNLLVDCFYDLAANPDVQEELRQEAFNVLEGEDNGWARKDSMHKLKKMDSFMKEVQRISGNVTSFIRKVVKPIDLSDGTYLPAGTKILTPMAGIANDSRYYPAPEKLDAFRFFKLRHQSEEDMNRHQFTTITDTYMNFGAGKHACPGRFFAGNEIKMILSYFLINFDFKLKDGEERPKAMMIMMSKTPNPNGEVLFKRRVVR